MSKPSVDVDFVSVGVSTTHKTNINSNRRLGTGYHNSYSLFAVSVGSIHTGQVVLILSLTVLQNWFLSVSTMGLHV